MADQQTHTNYSVADIEKYLTGTMNAKEMHEIEKAALQDPFLSDTIEGYRASSFTTSYAHLNEIAVSFAAERQPAKVIAMPLKQNSWVKRLAVAVIIIGAGFITWMLVDSSRQKSNVFAKGDIPRVTVPAPADTLKTVATPPLALNQVKVGPADKETRYKSNLEAKESFTLSDNNNQAGNQPVKKADTSFYFPPAGSVASANSNQVAGVSLAKVNKDSLAGDKAIPGNSNPYLNNNAFNTRNPKGPDVQANNLVANRQQDSFKPLADSTTASAMAFRTNQLSEKAKRVAASSSNAAPYALQHKAPGIVVTLTPQPGFDSVPVTYLNNKNGTHRIVADSSLFPRGGWESFRDYVSKKLHNKIDTSVIITGDVEVEFVIDDSGNARNIKVTRSLDDERDAQALDLVRKWPGWVAGKKNKKTKLVIQF